MCETLEYFDIIDTDDATSTGIITSGELTTYLRIEQKKDIKRL